MAACIKVVVQEFCDASFLAAPLELPLDCIHVWKRALKTPGAAVDACYELLSHDERKRASCYRVDTARNDFILTRGTLRSLIGTYVGRTPQELSFRCLDFGKPILEGPFDLRFNVSHTEGLALIALAKGREVGVDVESIRPELDARKLLRRFSSRQEHALNLLSDSELSAKFFQWWTRSEAYIKARGEDWSVHRFGLSMREGCPQHLAFNREHPEEASRWILCDLSTSPGYAAALAVEIARN